MGVHDGHRARLRRRFLREGMANFTDHEVLELMLCYAIPRQDVNPIAHRLIERFHSLDAVLDASPEALREVEGIGEQAAVFLKLFVPVARRYMKERASFDAILDNSAKLGRYLSAHFIGERDEVVYLLCLDAKLMVLDCRLMFRGSVNSSAVSVRSLTEAALACKATYAVLAHNHPSGIALPSREDELTTRRLQIALDTVDIALIDHIIVAGEDFVSMAQSGFSFDC